jgi:hypothetical protein
MPPSTAREPKPPGQRLISLVSRACLVAAVAALGSGGCGEPKPEVIARFPADASLGGAAGSGEGGAAGATDGGSAISIPRGRVRVVNGKLVTDIGTLLRAVVLPVDNGWADFSLVTSVAQTTGLNTLHVYLENSTQAPGSNVIQADALVALTAQAGLYLILGFGTGTAVGQFDAAKIKAFWAFYGARYANYSHVLYEIQNNPETTCDKPVAAATLTMEANTYAQIRAVAPDTHVLLFSTTSYVQPSVLTGAVQSLGTRVDWSNASFALTAYNPCLALADFGQLVTAAKTVNVPLMIGQLPQAATEWGPDITFFEQNRISWSQFTWFAVQNDIASYLTATTAAGLTWCPDRGTFPEDASNCR